MAEGIYHFPLQVGNQWIYEKKYPNGFETTWQVAVTRYSDGTPLLLYRLGTNVGTKWYPGVSGSMGACMDGGSAVLASHEEFVPVPAGEFTNAVRVDYGPRCLDAGLASEWFAAGVGLVKRIENSIAGPIESVLLSSRVGGTVLPDHPAATSLTLDRALIVLNKDPSLCKLEGAFRAHEQNTNTEGFAFQGCVSASVTLVNDGGKAVLATRLEGKGCCECKNPITLDLHGETLTLPFALALVDESGNALPDGHYSLNVVLDSLDAPSVRPSVTTHFHVGEAR